MLRVVVAEFKRNILTFVRYPTEAVVGTLLLTGVFYGLLVGSRYIAGPGGDALSSRVDMLVLTYVMWLFILSLFAGPAGEITQDSQTGTLEQWFMSSHRASTLCMARTIGGLAQSLVLIAMVLVILIPITGAHLRYSYSIVIPLAGIFLAAIGLGLILAAYALLVKRAQVMIAVCQFLVLFLIATPFEAMSNDVKTFAGFLPIAMASAGVRGVITHGVAITTLQDVGYVANGVVYLMVGIAVFELTSQLARRRGNLGTY